MSSPSRFIKIGLHGRKGTSNNQTDSFLQTIEIPILATPVPIGDSLIPMPGPNAVLISAFVQVNVAEVSAVTKLLSVGLVGGTDSEFLLDVDVSAVGWFGAAVGPGPFNSTANISFLLAGADFVELDSVAVLTFQSKV